MTTYQHIVELLPVDVLVDIVMAYLQEPINTYVQRLRQQQLESISTEDLTTDERWKCHHCQQEFRAYAIRLHQPRIFFRGPIERYSPKFLSMFCYTCGPIKPCAYLEGRNCLHYYRCLRCSTQHCGHNAYKLDKIAGTMICAQCQPAYFQPPSCHLL